MHGEVAGAPAREVFIGGPAGRAVVDDDVVGGIGAVGRCDAVADVGGRTVRIVADPHPPSQRLHPLPVLSSPIHLRCGHYGKRHPTHTDDVVVVRPWFKPQNGKWEEPRLLTGVLPTAQDGSPERRELEALPAKVEALETERDQLGERLADPALYRAEDGEAADLGAAFKRAEAAVTAAYARWEALEAQA